MEENQNYPEPQPCFKACDNWLERLADERVELKTKVKKLQDAIEGDTLRLTAKEWDLLRRQYSAMRDYLEAVEHRCVYYGILDRPFNF